MYQKSRCETKCETKKKLDKTYSYSGYGYPPKYPSLIKNTECESDCSKKSSWCNTKPFKPGSIYFNLSDGHIYKYEKDCVKETDPNKPPTGGEGSGWKPYQPTPPDFSETPILPNGGGSYVSTGKNPTPSSSRSSSSGGSGSGGLNPVDGQRFIGSEGGSYKYNSPGTTGGGFTGTWVPSQITPSNFGNGGNNGSGGGSGSGGYSQKGSYISTGPTGGKPPDDDGKSTGAIDGQRYITPEGSSYSYKAPEGAGQTGTWRPTQFTPSNFGNGSGGGSGSGSFSQGGSYVASGPTGGKPPDDDGKSTGAIDGQRYISTNGASYTYKSPGTSGNSGQTGTWIPSQFLAPSFVSSGCVKPGSTGSTGCGCCCDEEPEKFHPYDVSGYCNPVSSEGAIEGQVYTNVSTNTKYIFEEGEWVPLGGSGAGGGGGGGSGGYSYSGTGPPPPSLLGFGEGDSYLDTETGELYGYGSGAGEGSGEPEWSQTGMFLGNGSSSTTYISENGSPSETMTSAAANNGGYYIDSSTGYIYHSNGTEWERIETSSFKNSSSYSGSVKTYVGPSTPGLEGDISIDSSTGEVYEYRTEGSSPEWVSSAYSIKTGSGGSYYFGTSPPLSNSGYNTNSIFVDQSTGKVYSNEGSPSKWVYKGYSVYGSSLGSFNKGRGSGSGGGGYTYSGEGEPDSVSGMVEGNSYIDTLTGEVYTYSESGSSPGWSLSRLKVGNGGSSTYITRENSPFNTNTLASANSGSYYIDSSTGYIYYSNGTTWERVDISSFNGNRSGAYSGTVSLYTGPSMLGTEGNVAIDSSTGEIYEYRNGSWILSSRGYSIISQSGSYYFGSSPPLTQSGYNANSIFVDTSTGNVFSNESGTWVYQGYSIYGYNNSLLSTSSSLNVFNPVKDSDELTPNDNGLFYSSGNLYLRESRMATAIGTEGGDTNKNIFIGYKGAIGDTLAYEATGDTAFVGSNRISIGNFSGNSGQGEDSIAIGSSSGRDQGRRSIMIGNSNNVPATIVIPNSDDSGEASYFVVNGGVEQVDKGISFGDNSNIVASYENQAHNKIGLSLSIRSILSGGEGDGSAVNPGGATGMEALLLTDKTTPTLQGTTGFRSSSSSGAGIDINDLASHYFVDQNTDRLAFLNVFIRKGTSGFLTGFIPIMGIKGTAT